MAERPVKLPLPTGQTVDGLEIPIEESTERWSDVRLEDGTVLRVKTTVLSATRVTGQWDAEGHPLYFIKSIPTTAIVSSPDHLKRRVQ